LVAVNVDTAKQRTLARGNRRTLYWELDENFAPLIRVDRGRTEADIIIYTRDDSGKWVRRQNVNAIENDFKPAGRADGQGEMLVVHRPEDADRRGLYKYNLSTNTYGDLIYGDEKYDVSSVARAKYGRDILYVGWWEDQLEKKWFDEALGAAGAKLDSGLKPEDNWSILETSRDDKKWLVYVSSPQRPGSWLSL